jgi:hypothetical protein
LRKKPNIGASFGLSPTKAMRAFCTSISRPSTSAAKRRHMVSLSYSPNQPFTWIDETLATAPASVKS